MTFLSKYKNILGEPGKGFHSQRIFGMALYDIIGTILITLLWAYIEGDNSLQNLLYIFFIVFVIGQIFHIVFGVDTAFIKWLKKLF
jgi:hypothetical protein